MYVSFAGFANYVQYSTHKIDEELGKLGTPEESNLCEKLQL